MYKIINGNCLDVMREKGLQMDLELINPEDTSNFPYHATDIRNAILNKEFEKLGQCGVRESILAAVGRTQCREGDRRVLRNPLRRASTLGPSSSQTGFGTHAEKARAPTSRF